MLQVERQDWVTVLQTAVANVINTQKNPHYKTQNGDSPGESVSRDDQIAEHNRKRIRELMEQEDNNTCADCGEAHPECTPSRLPQTADS